MEIAISRDASGPKLDPTWLEEPPLIEVTAANEHLLQPFRERRSFGLRRLTQRRSSLYLEGKRFVPRGVHANSLID